MCRKSTAQWNVWSQLSYSQLRVKMRSWGKIKTDEVEEKDRSGRGKVMELY